jgi:hypothetical protein
MKVDSSVIILIVDNISGTKWYVRVQNDDKGDKVYGNRRVVIEGW